MSSRVNSGSRKTNKLQLDLKLIEVIRKGKFSPISFIEVNLLENGYSDIEYVRSYKVKDCTVYRFNGYTDSHIIIDVVEKNGILEVWDCYSDEDNFVKQYELSCPW